MPTYIDLGDENIGFVNADTVTCIQRDAGGGYIIIGYPDNQKTFHYKQVGLATGAAVLQELLRELGRPATQPGTRVITLENGHVVSRYLS
jgi:hypothetical protein